MSSNFEDSLFSAFEMRRWEDDACHRGIYNITDHTNSWGTITDHTNSWGNFKSFCLYHTLCVWI